MVKKNDILFRIILISLTLIILILLICIVMILFKKKIIELFDDNTNGLNICDGIIYINLENREDRKKLFLEEIGKINLEESKLHKISGVYIPKNGHKGCIQSHILALRMAKMNDWNLICIMEDDMELTLSPDDFNNYINNIFKEIKERNVNWDVLLLSYHNEKFENTEQYKYINKIINSTLGTCYIIKKEYLDKLLHLFEYCQKMMNYDKWGNNNKHEPYSLDQKWNELMVKDNWICSKNKLIIQRNIKSTTNAKGNI
jgi:GR25 family glycosyltransferase involved in LPS biosynthesis